MTNRSMTHTSRPTADHSQRAIALIAGFALLFVAVLAAFANFGVLKSLVVSGDPAATATKVLGSEGLFRAGIAGFLIVAILDVVVAWALYVLLRRVSNNLAVLVAWLRVAYAAVFAYALVNLLDVAQLLHGANATVVQSSQVQAQVASSIASFDNGWALGLGIFGLHLVGLGVLLFRFTAPRLLAALVVVAGVGYLADSFGKILVPDYTLTISTFTFVGEALLIFWLFWIAIRGVRSSDSTQVVGAPVLATEAVA
jgi:Domain of unknown function (DUF4386)